MSLLSPLSGVDYSERDYDLIRFLDSPVDDAVANIVRSVADALDERRDDFRRGLDESARQTLALFARRRVVLALRSGSLRDIGDALDTYALSRSDAHVPWESWFKATLLLARDAGLDLDEALERFTAVATEDVARRAGIAFEAVSRITDLAECHLHRTDTTYGVGIVETLIVRQANDRNLLVLGGSPPKIGQFEDTYSPSTNLAQLAVDVADALDASGRFVTSSIQDDQLAGTLFDLVTAGSFVDSVGCFGFFADPTGEGPSLSVLVAEIGAEEHYDSHFAGDHLAAELAEAADGIIGQAAWSTGPQLILLSELPTFDDTGDDEDETYDEDEDNGSGGDDGDVSDSLSPIDHLADELRRQLGHESQD